MMSAMLPKDLPAIFLDSAFISLDGEAAWPPQIATEVVDWLGNHSYGVLGADIWIVTPESDIFTTFRDLTGQDCVWAIAVDRGAGEYWGSYCSRAASTVSESIRKIDISEISASGRVLVNLTFASEQ